ncbi:MAG TPA: helicase HerA-like domain-containing protein [Vicinamibacterales bacterium]|nr:helicase HerA-like domain-containing protein [Vicinamibacterales bacterium]
MSEPFAIAKTTRGDEVLFRPALANRHGLITGATGTGKTVTLQMLADHFSRMGVPVFMADVKGDLSGVAAAGSTSAKLKERLQRTGIAEPEWSADPVVFWDVFGKHGFPLRATISDLGPLLLGRLFNLNPTQQGVLALAFKIADDQGLLLLDLKDLRAMLTYVGNKAKEFRTEYGNVSTASIGAIQRALLEVEEQGGDAFFGEPMLNVDDLLQTDSRGRGLVHVLTAEELIRSPKVYATFLLWLLSELFEQLPEVGDRDTPTLVFFFDEAHLLFNDAPDALVEKIEQVVRLIRSKGVGVYFVTQNPADVPETVLGQLGNRIQHALRAFTPRDQKAVKVAAETLRPNPAIDTAAAISELAVGEALVSLLDEKGSPTVTARAWILPPSSRIGPITDAERSATHEANKAFYGEYEHAVDRESAYEKLTGRTAKRVDAATDDEGSAKASAERPVETAGAPAADEAPAAPVPPRKTKAEPRVTPEPPASPQRSEPWAEPTQAGAGAAADSGLVGALSEFLFGRTGPRGGHYPGALEAVGKSAARSIGSGIGREILRGTLGSIMGSGRRR